MTKIMTPIEIYRCELKCGLITRICQITVQKKCWTPGNQTYETFHTQWQAAGSKKWTSISQHISLHAAMKRVQELEKAALAGTISFQRTK